MKEPLVTVVLPGPVRGKGRPRFRIIKTRDGRQFTSTYTDAATQSYEGALRHEAVLAMRGKAPLNGPLRVKVTAVFDVPISWSDRKTRQALDGLIRPTGRPDIDNIMKCLDSCNGIVWRDDAQIVAALVSKFYGEKPSLCLEVWNAAATIPKATAAPLLLPLEAI